MTGKGEEVTVQILDVHHLVAYRLGAVHQNRDVPGVGQPDHLQLNPQGGNIGLGVSNPVHPVQVAGGPDVTPSGGGALVVGITTNIAIDQNEIQAHAAGAPSLLTLNNDGGNVRIGGWLGVGLATIIKGRNPLLDGFGLIAFASLLPMIFVMLYGITVFGVR